MKFPILLIAFVTSSTALPEVIRVGGLFDGSDPTHEIAFRYSIERVNANRNVLPRSRLTSSSERLPPNDSFTASKKVCQLFRIGVAALFGPSSETTSHYVQSMSEAIRIPHVDYETRSQSNSWPSELAVNVHPHFASLSRAYWDVIRGYGWKSFTILYQDIKSLVRLQDLLRVSTITGYKVTIRQLTQSEDYRPLLKEMKRNSERNIVLDCDIDKIPAIFLQAQQVGLMSLAHSYFITSLDMHVIDLEKHKYDGANITGFQIIDPGKAEITNAIGDWVYGEMRHGRTLELTEKSLKVETALIYDAVQLFAKALHELDRNHDVHIKSMNCEGSDTWSQGANLINYMKLMELDGLTGPIKFDSQGLRTNFHLNLIELQSDGLNAVGTWNLVDGANFSRMHAGVHNQDDSLFNRTLIVTSVVNSPYFLYKEGYEQMSGNDRFEGFCLDIIDEMSKMLGFNYVFKPVGDGKHGRINPNTGEWDGMIRELLDGKADLALADLSISLERASAVDFTIPFLNTGISILYKRPQKKVPSLFSFMSPFSIEVWIYTCTAYLGVSLLLFILSRITPIEWNNPHPCRQEPDILENQFTLLNSMWLAIGALMQQGSDIMPKATSTRMCAGFWWFFTLIMISSYTANLAAFLTAERMDSPITSAEDLAKQTKIKYGCLPTGSTFSFFRNSAIATYQQMYSFMESTKPSVFAKKNEEGVERVQRENGKYAFLMESASIEFFTERRCDLIQIGGLMDSKGYGIAMRPGSSYRAALSQALLRMQENNRLLILKNKWWKEKLGGGVCNVDDGKASASAAELGLANVGGVFVVLVSGMFAALVIAFLEFAWKSRKLALNENESFWVEMFRELKITLSSGNTKPVTRRLN